MSNDVNGLTEITGSVTISGPIVITGPLDVDVVSTVGLTDTELRATPVPVSGTVSITGTVTFANGAQTAVSSSAVPVIAANVNRKALILQNVGAGNVRVGKSGVAATTGALLLANGGQLILSGADNDTGQWFAIRDGSTDSTVLAMEAT